MLSTFENVVEKRKGKKKKKTKIIKIQAAATLFRGMYATSIICNQYDDKKSMMLLGKISANALDRFSLTCHNCGSHLKQD